MYPHIPHSECSSPASSLTFPPMLKHLTTKSSPAFSLLAHTYRFPTVLEVSYVTLPVQCSFSQHYFTASLISPTCCPFLPHILPLWCTEHCCQQFILHSFKWHKHSEQPIGKMWKYRHGLVSGTTAPFS